MAALRTKVTAAEKKAAEAGTTDTEKPAGDDTEQIGKLQAQLEDLGRQWPLLDLKNLVAVPQEDAELAGPENPLQTMIQDALHASDASEELRAKVIELLPIIIGGATNAQKY